MIRIVVADDQEIVRSGIARILSGEQDLDVVAEVGDGEAALAAVARHAPDLVLMDIRMPRMDGLAATQRLQREQSRVRVVVLTTFDLDEYVYEALRAGASGFVLKDSPPEELLRAVRIVARGDALLDPGVTRRLIAEFTARHRPDDSRLRVLTPRETEVLAAVGRGLNNAEIARTMFVSEGTVRTHVGHLFAKLGLRDRVQAVVVAYETGLVRPGG